MVLDAATLRSMICMLSCPDRFSNYTTTIASHIKNPEMRDGQVLRLYAIGTPHFPKVTIFLPNGKQFEIVANNLSAQNFYIRSATLNGVPLNRFWLLHSEIVRGGKLVFEMAGQPNPSWPASTTAPDGLAR